MKKGRSVPVCRSGQKMVQMGLVNIEIGLNSGREKTWGEGAAAAAKREAGRRRSEL